MYSHDRNIYYIVDGRETTFGASMVEVYFKSLYDLFEGTSRVYYSLSSTLSKRKKMQRAKRQKK